MCIFRAYMMFFLGYLLSIHITLHLSSHDDNLIHLNAPAVSFMRSERKMPVQHPVK